MVPAQAQPVQPRIVIIPSRRWPANMSSHPVIVIPKDMLDRPVLRKNDLVASAGQ